MVEPCVLFGTKGPRGCWISNNKPGTAQVGAPLKVQKEQLFLHLRRDTIMKVQLKMQRQNLPEGNPYDSENMKTPNNGNENFFQLLTVPDPQSPRTET